MTEYVANEINKLRIASGVTQEELADAVGVSRQTIIAIERGKYTPSVLLALKLGKYFTTPVEKLFTIRHEK
jgi:putative transcriptional regulator